MRAATLVLDDFGRAGLLTGARLMPSSETRPYQYRNVVSALTGRAFVSGKEVTLVIGVTSRFPFELPLVFLYPRDALGIIPHVMFDGLVCYADGEGLVLDEENPVGVLAWAFHKALRTLEDGFSGLNHADFIDEFRYYWNSWANPAERVLSLVEPTAEVRRLVLSKDRSGTLWVMDDERQLDRYHKGVRDSQKMVTANSAVFIPLRPDAVVLPPLPDRPWTTEHVQRIIRENLSPSNMGLLHEIGRRTKWEEFVVLSVPRPSGGVVLCGLRFRKVTGSHPLLGGTAEDSPQLVDIQRMDRSYLVPRGGASLDLGNAHVLLVGCGSVGGHIATALSQNGVGKLTIVDPDTLQPENIYRHVLGRSGLGLPKVLSLKAEIEHKYPYVSVTPHRKHIDQAVASAEIRLFEFDLIISATGAPTVDLHLNRIIHKTGVRQPAIFTWLEPFGIGGHALLTRSGSPGCLQCLFGDANHPLYNCASFAAEGQTFSRDDLGCGSRYTPFGGLDALQTGHLASRLALNALHGREQGSPIWSWKGYEQEFVSAGFQPSQRYGQSFDQLHERRYAYVQPECSVCGRTAR